MSCCIIIAVLNREQISEKLRVNSARSSEIDSQDQFRQNSKDHLEAPSINRIHGTQHHLRDTIINLDRTELASQSGALDMVCHIPYRIGDKLFGTI